MTPSVPREINPVFKHTMVFRMLRRDDVLQFTLRDVGMFANEHLGGRLGPAVIAVGSLKVGEHFEGYLDMVATKTGFGDPVLKVQARFPRYEIPDLPATGTAEAVIGMLRSSVVPEPRAPLPPPPVAEPWAPSPVIENTDEELQQAMMPEDPKTSASFGVGMSGGGSPDAVDASHGTPALDGGSGVGGGCVAAGIGMLGGGSSGDVGMGGGSSSGDGMPGGFEVLGGGSSSDVGGGCVAVGVGMSGGGNTSSRFWINESVLAVSKIAVYTQT